MDGRRADAKELPRPCGPSPHTFTPLSFPQQPDAELEAAAVAGAARRGAAPAQPPVLPALPALHVRLGRTVAPSPKPVRHVARPLFGRGPTQAELDEFFGAAEAEEAERFAARWGFDVRTERPTQTAAQTGWEWSTVGE